MCIRDSGKTRKQTECDGQTGYTEHILDGIIDKVVRQIFERMKAIPKDVYKRQDFLRPEDGKSPYQLQPFAKRAEKDVSR